MPCPSLLLACWPYTHQLKEKASDLYVEDGAVKGGSNFNIRVITDSASYALAAKALLDQSKVSGWPFEKAVNVYAAGGAKPFVGVMFAGGKEGNVTGMEKGWGAKRKEGAGVDAMPASRPAEGSGGARVERVALPLLP
jgi:hypothetical protein